METITRMRATTKRVNGGYLPVVVSETWNGNTWGKKKVVMMGIHVCLNRDLTSHSRGQSAFSVAGDLRHMIEVQRGEKEDLERAANWASNMHIFAHSIAKGIKLCAERYGMGTPCYFAAAESFQASLIEKMPEARAYGFELLKKGYGEDNARQRFAMRYNRDSVLYNECIKGYYAHS